MPCACCRWQFRPGSASCRGRGCWGHWRHCRNGRGTVYALGWKARDRAAGVGAGLLLALSPQFLFWAAYSPQSAAFSLLSVARAVRVCRRVVACGPGAGGHSAAMIRPDGLLLGLLLLALSFGQQCESERDTGRLVFFVPLLAFEIGRRIIWTTACRACRCSELHFGVWRWLWTPASALLVWLLVPFCGEFGEGVRRVPAGCRPSFSGAVLVTTDRRLPAQSRPRKGMLLPLHAPALLCWPAAVYHACCRPWPESSPRPGPALRAGRSCLCWVWSGLHLRLEPPVPQTD